MVRLDRRTEGPPEKVDWRREFLWAAWKLLRTVITILIVGIIVYAGLRDLSRNITIVEQTKVVPDVAD